MLTELFQKKAVKKYLIELPERLKRDYGGSQYYTYGQIKTAVVKYKLPKKYLYYAVVSFIDPEDLDVAFKEHFPDKSGKEVRGNVAKWYFHGNWGFAPHQSKFSSVGNSGNDSMAGGTPCD